MRKVIFWLHLGTGITAGLVILLMSVTGVLLTYERQMVAWSNRVYRQEPAAGQTRLSINTLVDTVRQYAPGMPASSVVIAADPAAPVIVALGRGREVYLQPYAGVVLGEGSPGMHQFFQAVTGWHRWFNAGPESRTTMRAVTGACNLAFLFMILSGLYLWIPDILRWPMFRSRLLFSRSYRSSKGRDFNWHHVFGFWSAIPLAFVVVSGVVISYPWASNLVYQAVGEEPPQGRPGGPPGFGDPGGDGPGRPTDPRDGRSRPEEFGRIGPPNNARGSGTDMAAARQIDFDRLYARAATHLPDWRNITMRIPYGSTTTPIVFSIDQGTGGQPQHRHNLTLDADTGDVVSFEPFDSQSRGSQLRVYLRFLHTGEVLGLAGQTLAGLVSAATVMLVWTGFALAWRRLIQPLLRNRTKRP